MADLHCRTRIRTGDSDSKPYGYIVLYRNFSHWFGALSHSISIVQGSESGSGNVNQPLDLHDQSINVSRTCNCIQALCPGTLNRSGM